jgi:hypothetical protein
MQTTGEAENYDLLGHVLALTLVLGRNERREEFEAGRARNQRK